MKLLIVPIVIICLTFTDGFLFSDNPVIGEVLGKLYEYLLESDSKPPTAVRTRGINGGFSCGACTVLLSVAEQLTQVHNETAEESLERMCTYLPEAYKAACGALTRTLTPLVAAEILAHTSPDTICYRLGICYVDEGKRQCNLFPPPDGSNEVANWRMSQTDLVVPARYRRFLGRLSDWPWVCHVPGVSELCQALDNIYDRLTPGVDLDGDKFSPVENLRGSIWRGRDCNDVRADHRPGRRALDEDREHDSNCNGILGVNVTSQRPFEEELCGGSGQRGVLAIGDSVTAHFHAPPVWFTPAELTQGILTNITYVVSNEGNWPDVGFATGFRGSSPMPPLLTGAVDSIYLRLRERNLCNHRDYQNLARNGAESNDTLQYMRSLSRLKEEDHPAIVFYSLIGNDVCNEKEDTEAKMTPVDVFYNNTLKTLNFLEDHLPPGSHVVLMGLIDGSILYDAMAHRLHPLGQLNGDVHYTDMYRWFNCMEMGPCHGWMTSNSTLRKITTKHARQLTRVLKHVAAREKFDSFDIHFVENPFKKVINDWLDSGGEVSNGHTHR